MGKFVDLSGNKYGLLTVIKRVGTRNGKAEWLCQCDCGNLHTTISHSLTHGLCQSCGCINRNMGYHRSNKYHRSNNRYDLNGDYGIGITAKKEE